MAKNELVSIVLAAGGGTRMVSSIHKVLHNICGEPMLDHILDAISHLPTKQVYVISGFQQPKIVEHIAGRAICVTQRKRLGTAHAVSQAKQYLTGFEGDVLITCGDTPLLTPKTLEKIVTLRRRHKSAGVVLTTELDDPEGYGRIVRNRDGTIRKIVEEKDTNIYEVAIKEVNTGTYCFDSKILFRALLKVRNNNAQKEYYLTDVVEILSNEGYEVEAVVAEDPMETIGVNSRKDLALAEKYMRMRIIDTVMQNGATVIDPTGTYIDSQVKIGMDTVIYPFTIIRGDTEIGRYCSIGPNVQISDSKLKDSAIVTNSVVKNSSIGEGVTIGPHCSVGPETTIGAGATIGSFVEVAHSTIKKNARLLTHSYVSNAEVRDRAVIGAGVVVCDSDGHDNHRSIIGSDACIGSNASLIAPVQITAHTIIEPGSTVTGIVKRKKTPGKKKC